MLWKGSVIRATGYGQYRTETHNLLAHRVAYELFVGPIPEGHEIHHVCNNRLCVEPRHLVALTKHEHWRISDNPSAKRARQTHCQRGHEFTPENTHVNKRGHRRCRRCAREDARRERGDWAGDVTDERLFGRTRQPRS